MFGWTRGHPGKTVADAAEAEVTVTIAFRPKPGRGFIVQPRRWVVEPTNGWTNHCRRIDSHYQTTLTAHKGFPILAKPLYNSDDSTAASCFDTL